MGNCGNCCNTSHSRENTNNEAQFSPVEEENNDDDNNNIIINNINNNNTDDNNNINLKNLQSTVIPQTRIKTETIKQVKTWGQKKDNLSNKNYMTIDKPDIIDNLNTDNYKNDISLSISMDQSEFIINLSQMENELFDIINELRSNPQSFITHIEKYKGIYG